MKTAIKIILILLFLSPVYTFAQSTQSFEFLRTINGDITRFAVDNLDNVYLVTSTDQIKKIGANGDSVAVYNDIKKHGKLSIIDASNPLRVLLYYEDFSTIVVLDRFMNVRTSIDLRKQNIFKVRTIGQAYDNNIWVYDELENKLKKIDEEGKLVLETSDFRQLFTDTPSPRQIFDLDGFVYLYDPERSVYVFDYYGALKNKILIAGWDNFRVAGKYIFGTVKDTLNRYSINNFSVVYQKLPPALYPANDLQFTSTRLYVLKQDSLRIYSIR